MYKIRGDRLRSLEIKKLNRSISAILMVNRKNWSTLWLKAKVAICKVSLFFASFSEIYFIKFILFWIRNSVFYLSREKVTKNTIFGVFLQNFFFSGNKKFFFYKKKKKMSTFSDNIFTTRNILTTLINNSNNSNRSS